MDTFKIITEKHYCDENCLCDVQQVVPQGFTLKGAASTIANYFNKGKTAYQLTGELMNVVEGVGTAAMAAQPVLATLGLSREALPTVPEQYRLLPFNLATTNCEDTVNRLGVDYASGVTIDGTELGTTGIDELDVNYIVGTEVFLRQTTWATGADNGPGDFKLGVLATPVQGRLTTQLGSPTRPQISFDLLLHTPASLVGSMFKYWRGDMVFTFRVPASRFYNGRLRIWYEPYTRYDSQEGSPEFNLVNSVVLDLAVTNEVRLVVPWNNIRDSLRCQTSTTGFERSTTNVNDFETMMTTLNFLEPTNGCANGYVVCEVMQELTSSGTTIEPVDILLFMHMENAAFYAPTHPILGWMDEDAQRYSPVSQNYDASGGECVPSLRMLMKRYTRLCAGQFEMGGSTLRRMQTLFTNYSPGYTVTDVGCAQHSTVTSLGVTAYGANFFAWTPESLIRMCYAFMRGSVRKKLILAGYTSTTEGRHLAVSRWSEAVGAFQNGGRIRDQPRVLVPGENTDSSVARSFLESSAETWEGTQVGQWNAVSGVLDIELPFYSQYRAVSPRRAFHPLGATGYGDDRDEMAHVVTVDAESSAGTRTPIPYEIYTAIGEDYNLMEFMHAPAIIVNELPPAVITAP